jgi:hypothetical protein
MRIGLRYMGTIFRTRETEPYNGLMIFCKIELLLEHVFYVKILYFKIEPRLGLLLKMLLEVMSIPI